MGRKKVSTEDRRRGIDKIAEFPLLAALSGRRSRRFAKGCKIPQGAFTFESKEEPEPLSGLETAIVVSAMAGTTGWLDLHPYNGKYAPHLPNYAASAGGRTFPSAAGFHSSDLFYTDDSGTYFFSTRDRAPADADASRRLEHASEAWLDDHRKSLRKISDQRLEIPREGPHMESHNLWISNVPGSLLAVPVLDLAQHSLLVLCYLVQNGFGIFDDVRKERIPGIEKFKGLIDVDNPYPLSYVEQLVLGEAAVEVGTSCYAGALMLQAMGLGGWMYNGIDRHSIFGVTGDPRNKGLGFRSNTREDWLFANPTGLPGVFEATCPPRFPDMRAAVEFVVERKFGEGGPFNPKTPGPWKEPGKIRGSAQVHDERFKDCVATMAQFIYDRYGKFPAQLPSMYCLMVLQVHHLDLEYYDTFFGPGAYLDTHRAHDRDWH